MRTDTANIAGNNYDKYESTNPIEKRMMAGFFAGFDHMLEGLVPASIVELGAGEGRVAERLAGKFPNASVVGLDLPDDGLAAEWSSRDITMFFGDATRLPFADRSIDLIVGLEVLEHIPNPERVLDEIVRVCRGTAVLSVPREPIWRVGNIVRGRYVAALGNTPGHINHWSARSFRSFVASRLAITDSANPLPWTMVRCTPR